MTADIAVIFSAIGGGSLGMLIIIYVRLGEILNELRAKK